MQELLDYAASSQDEVCGLIIDDERLFRCRNIHPDPGMHFRISDDEWLAAEDEGEVTAVFHSHPGRVPFCQEQTATHRYPVDFRGGWLAMV